jgi:hypothetical protein
MTSLLVEEEAGTYTARFRHPHNGYYAGDFSSQAPSSGRAHDTSSSTTRQETR